MRAYQIYEKAKEFGIMPESALEMRMRYLREEIDFLMECEGTPVLKAAFILKDIAEHNELRERWRQEKCFREGSITDEMIERARSTPIEIIIEFQRGKVRCIDPDHDDKHPSAFYGRRTNRLVCPVCNKTWDAIACYQYVYDVDFKSAVRSLQ